MIHGIFNSAYGEVPVMLTGQKKNGLVEVYAIKHRPFTQHGFYNATYAERHGYVRKGDLAELKSTRIITDPCEFCGKQMTDGWRQSCWKDEATGLNASNAYKLVMKTLEAWDEML